MRRLALLPLFALTLVSWGHGARPVLATPAGPLAVRVTLAPAQPRCDGDSVRLTVSVTRADGSPAPGAAVSIVMPDGVSSATLARTTAATVSGATDARGVLRARLTPAPGTRTRFLFVVAVTGGPAPHPAVGACPFPDVGPIAVHGTVFLDANGDGVQGVGERPLTGQAVAIYGMCYGPGCFVPLHSARADASGRFGWTGLPASDAADPRAIPSWRICVPEGAAARRLVSLDGVALSPADIDRVAMLGGAAVPPQQCAAVAAPRAGANAISVGLR